LKLFRKALFLVFSCISGFISCSLLLAVLVSIGNKNASFIVWDPGPMWVPLMYLIVVLMLNIFCSVYIAKKEKYIKLFIIVFIASFILFPMFL
jgi:hypothetical protein